MISFFSFFLWKLQMQDKKKMSAVCGASSPHDTNINITLTYFFTSLWSSTAWIPSPPPPPPGGWWCSSRGWKLTVIFLKLKAAQWNQTIITFFFFHYSDLCFSPLLLEIFGFLSELSCVSDEVILCVCEAFRDSLGFDVSEMRTRIWHFQTETEAGCEFNVTATQICCSESSPVERSRQCKDWSEAVKCKCERAGKSQTWWNYLMS